MTDVIVVGAGVIGLTAALRLQERGARVSVWTAHEPARTVSSVAAAVWYPSHTGAGPRTLRWAARSHDEFGRQLAAGVPGLLARRTRMLLRTPPGGPPWWAQAAGGVELREARPPYAAELRFTAHLAEMDTYLSWLRTRLLDGGGDLVHRRVTSLDEATAPVVVNATGLAARGLCADTAVHPVRGHVVMVGNPGLDESVRDEDDPDGLTYVHPRTRDVVLGGTYEPGRPDDGPDLAGAAAIVRRCLALEPRLARAPLLGERVGLRPARHGGPRVEAVRTPDGRRLVHAYGHGGAGMTLSWGCADEIADLAGGPPQRGADGPSPT